MKELKLNIRIFFSIIVYLLKLTPFQKRKNGLLNVINYHYFVNDKSEIKDKSLEILYSSFEKQISIITKYYKILAAAKDLKQNFLKKKKKIIKNSIIITVDDADFAFIKAINTINKYNVPVIMFAPIGFCLKKNDINGLRSRCLHFAFFQKNLNNNNIKKELDILFKYVFSLSINDLKKYYKTLVRNQENFFLSKKFLSIKNLKKISKNNLITISSHSMSHVPLSYLPKNWLNWEITMSQKFIEKCGGDKSFFAYPYGYKNSYNKKVKEILKKNNVKFAFTTLAKINTQNDDPLELGRTFASNFTNKNYMLGNASGAFYLYDKILNRL